MSLIGHFGRWQRSEIIPTYASDFSESVSDWSPNQCSIASVDANSNGAGIPPSSDWMRVTAGNRFFPQLVGSSALLAAFPSLGTYRLDWDNFVPSGSSILNGPITVECFHGGGYDYLGAAAGLSEGESSRSFEFTFSGVLPMTVLRFGRTTLAISGDLWFIKNVKIYKL